MTKSQSTFKPTAPVIKGLFVNSHIKRVRQLKGEEGVKALERSYGKPLRFKNLQDVPVREEVKVIKAALDILNPRPVPAAQRELEAGKLHFRNFTTTPYGRILFTALPKNFKTMMMNAKYIAQHVFGGVTFDSVELGPKAVRITMANNDYSIDHFRGLFMEWMAFFGLKGSVKSIDKGRSTYEYTLRWQ